MRISVVGTGYVGLVSGACFAEVGHECICVDLDASKVKRINSGETVIHENGLADIISRHIGRSLRATTDLRTAVLGSDITFVAVGTPFSGDCIDLSFVRDAARQIGTVLRDKDGYHAVVVKSTVVPGTTDDVVTPILEKESGKRAGSEFGVGMNPEFLTEGTAVEDFMKPDRIVLGGNDRQCIEVQQKAYEYFSTVPTIRTNNKTAEMIKYASNALLANLISFSNEFATVCSAIGDVDAADVMKGVHLSRYFTSTTKDQQSITAPITAFLWPGCGYGGSCLPKDTKALASHAAALGASMPVLEAVIRTNTEQPSKIIELLDSHFAELSRLRVAVLGLAFRPDTDDVRESPALEIVRTLIDRGVAVKAYDPIATETARAVLPDEGIEFANSLNEALVNIDAAVLLTRWDEFSRLSELLSGGSSSPLLIDGRRMLDKQEIERYAGIGIRDLGAELEHH